MSISALSSVEPKSIRPSERMISTQMDRWLQLAYDYYSLTGDHPSTPRETMANVSHYLATVNAQLKNPDRPVSSATSAIPAAASSSVSAPASVAVPGPVADDECQVCLEPFEGRRYGLLKQCDHKYCEPCVRTLLRSSAGSPLKCPTCLCLSKQVIFSSAFHPRGPQKDALFGSYVCVAHQENRSGVTRSTSYLDIHRRTIRARAPTSW